MRLIKLVFICVLVFLCSEVVVSAPFKLKLFDQTGFGGDVNVDPVLDIDGMLLKVIRCLPQKSRFNIDVNLETRVGSGESFDTNVGNLGRYYVGIVAKMPLYSAIEIDRTVKIESDIRLKISGFLGDIANNVVIVRTSSRELGLYMALEERSKRRIRAGVAFTEEQVKYLEKVIRVRNVRNKAVASINTSRLKLISLCRVGKRDSVSTDLNNIIERALNVADK